MRRRATSHPTLHAPSRSPWSVIANQVTRESPHRHTTIACCCAVRRPRCLLPAVVDAQEHFYREMSHSISRRGSRGRPSTAAPHSSHVATQTPRLCASARVRAVHPHKPLGLSPSILFAQPRLLNQSQPTRRLHARDGPSSAAGADQRSTHTRTNGTRAAR